MADKNTIKNWFRTNLVPTQAQFWALLDSYFHKDEKIPITAIDDIENILADKADAEALTNHINNKGEANGYTPLNEFLKVASEYLNIVDDLVTGGATSLASAETVKTLKTQIDGIQLLLNADDVNLDTVQERIDMLKSIQLTLDTMLVNDLTTGGTTKALTAEMGKTLKGLIDNIASASGLDISNKQDKSLFSALSNTFMHYYDSATQKLLPVLKYVSGTVNQLEFTGRIKADSFILPNNTNPAVANRLRSDGKGLWFANDLAVERKVSIGSVFTYVPTANFTLTAIKTAAESAGFIWNDLTIEITLGTNNFTCSIDTAIGTIIYLTRTGTGSISFTSSRTLDSGVDLISVLNGNNSSCALVVQKTDKDYLKIRNY